MTRKTQGKETLTDAEIDAMVGIGDNDDEQRETKSRRVISLFKPSIYADLEKLAFLNQTSVNNTINMIIEEYIGSNQALIDKYDDIMSQLENLRKK